jgi:Fe-S cluster assembly iron-binding protein IscA
MLEIDEDAVEALARMGGLRITAEETDEGVEIQIDEASEPQAGDETVERGEARVYLDPAAAEILADQVLGVHAHDDHFHFTFEEQSA